MNNFRRSRAAPKILIADDDPCVLRAIADRCAWMGFEVETATNGLKALIRASRYNPDVILIDVHMPEVDGLSVCAFLQDIAKQSPQLLVMTGRPGQEIVERCEGFNASCIPKGHSFWNELEARLTDLFPDRAVAISRAGKRTGRVEVRKQPRVLLVDDDVSVKKFFFRRFEQLGAELLYAADATQGFWTARREEPAVIVADFCMPKGDAEYLLNKLRNAPETRRIPVIVHTGRRLSDLVKQRLGRQICGQPGVTRILQKSRDGRELFEALQRLCGFASDLDGESLYQ
jgi:CheY-like chemotaxis protein